MPPSPLRQSIATPSAAATPATYATTHKTDFQMLEAKTTEKTSFSFPNKFVAKIQNPSETIY
jgi:hypothetical protein